MYLERGFPSMHKYLVRELHLSDGVAYHRLTAARAARKYPLLLERIASGEIHLSGVEKPVSHLTKENHRELLDRAKRRTNAEIKELVADLAPRPDVPSSIRKLPSSPGEPTPQLESLHEVELSESRSTLESPLGEIPNRDRDLPAVEAKRTPPPEPLGLGRYEVTFTADRALMGKLQELQALLRHQIPDGDLAKIVDRAATLLLEEVKRQKFGKVHKPRCEKSGSTNGKGASRHIPAEIKRAVAERDGERCSYVSPDGRRCGSREFLEYEHLKPWAKIHRHRAEEITLRCRARNQHGAMLEFGRDYIERCKRERRRVPTAGDSHGQTRSVSSNLGMPDPG